MLFHLCLEVASKPANISPFIYFFKLTTNQYKKYMGNTSVYTVEVRSLDTPQPNTFKLSFSQFLTFNPSKKFPVLGQLGSQLHLKNVKCQNNSRENDLFQLFFLSSHSQWVRSLHTLNQYLVALPLNSLTWVKRFGQPSTSFPQ